MYAITKIRTPPNRRIHLKERFNTRLSKRLGVEQKKFFRALSKKLKDKKNSAEVRKTQTTALL